MNKDKLEYRYRPSRSYKVPKQTLLQRYPRTIIGTITGISLLIFFSRPLYDAFLRPASDFLPLPEKGQRRH